MARVGGNQGNVGLGNGSISLTGLEGFMWNAEITHGEEITTPFQYIAVRRDATILDIKGELAFFITSGTTPPIPDGNFATLTLTTLTGHTYAFTALIIAQSIPSSNSVTAEKVKCVYSFGMSAQTSSDTITVT